MGDYKIVIEAVGGHGCQRDVKDGETVAASCGQESCPDCQARAFVAQLRHYGNMVKSATLAHWPTATPPGPVDDLLTLERKGSF